MGVGGDSFVGLVGVSFGGVVGFGGNEGVLVGVNSYFEGGLLGGFGG